MKNLERKGEDDSHSKHNQGILAAVGNTPLVHLARTFSDFSGTVYGKLEGLNPGGSSKDRPAREMIRDALARGEINQSTVIIESSSGNMGIGLAQACALFGLQFICVIDGKTTEQNRQIISAYGAKIDLVSDPDPETGELLQARLKRVQVLLGRTSNSYWPNQYSNQSNARAHYRSVMHEILGSLGGPLDYLLVPTSTCGTIRGCWDFVIDYGLETEVIAVDAVGSQIFSTERGSRNIPGLGAGLRPPLCPQELVRCIHVTDLDCILGCRRLARREGILVGGSSGGALAAFVKLMPSIPKGSTSVLMFPDRGERYLDTVFNDQWVKSKIGSSISRERPWNRSSTETLLEESLEVQSA